MSIRAGYWGKRFSPGTFLAELGTDGHYTRIWMETGIIGLILYLGMILFIIFYLGRLLWMMEDSLLRQVLVGFYSGFLGLCLSSYTNGLLTQIPTGVMVFISLSLIYMGANGRIKEA
jgi:O-antigen ligase